MSIRCLKTKAVRSERRCYRCVLEMAHEGNHQYGVIEL